LKACTEPDVVARNANVYRDGLPNGQPSTYGWKIGVRVTVRLAGLDWAIGRIHAAQYPDYDMPFTRTPTPISYTVVPQGGAATLHAVHFDNMLRFVDDEAEWPYGAIRKLAQVQSVETSSTAAVCQGQVTACAVDAHGSLELYLVSWVPKGTLKWCRDLSIEDLTEVPPPKYALNAVVLLRRKQVKVCAYNWRRETEPYMVQSISTQSGPYEWVAEATLSAYVNVVLTNPLHDVGSYVHATIGEFEVKVKVTMCSCSCS
jgi:hypothetical protein